jgi:signal transduction histidine kinase
MRRRITFAMVAMVAGALLLAGVVTFAVTVHAARDTDRRQLASAARGVAVSVQTEAETARPRHPAQALRTILKALKAPLRLQDDAVVAISPSGRLFDPVDIHHAVRLPKGLSRADLDLAALRQLRGVSAETGGLVFAAAPYRVSVAVHGVDEQVIDVVVLSRRPPTGLSAAGPWFLGAAAAIIVAALVVADRLSRRFVRPLLAAQRTTEQIAAGDLGARVPEPPGTDPELAALGASVNAMADGLARSRDVERRFLLSVSHDLRTPLTSIRGFAEAIEEGVTTDTARAASTIAAEARRLERLVGDLIDLAKFESRQFSLRLTRVDLADVVEATIGGFGPEAARLGIALQVQADPLQPEIVTADSDRLGQVVANLAENALSFARTSVWVGVGRSSMGPVLWVDDDGPGIAPADLPRVFERLYSSRPESAHASGSGLGLAIVAELVGALGGTVEARSPLLANGGTRMVVTLPPG